MKKIFLDRSPTAQIRRFPGFALLTILIATSVILTGCAIRQGTPSPASTPVTAAAPQPVVDTHSVTGSWQLLSWQGNDAPALPLGREVYLTFNDGKFSGSGGCNRIFGTYRMGPADQQIKLNPPAATRMACPDSINFESHFLALLPRIRQFERTVESLTLVATTGDRLIFAQRLPTGDDIASATVPPAAVQERIIEVDSHTTACSGLDQRQCLRVRGSASEPWVLWDAPIDGFTRQPGVKYLLRVRGERIDNPPADALNVRWSLVDVIQRSTPKITQ